MRRLATILFMTTLSVMGHLLFDMYHAQCLAATAQVSAVTRLGGEKNPTEGALALEQSGVRLGLSIGADSRASATADLIRRSAGGLYVGVGLVADRLGDADFYTESTADTVTTGKKHDHGKHKGDKHVRGGKTVTTISGHVTSFRFGTYDLGLAPSILIGVAARRGLFAESRVLVMDGEMANRTSVGIRW